MTMTVTVTSQELPQKHRTEPEPAAVTRPPQLVEGSAREWVLIILFLVLIVAPPLAHLASMSNRKAIRSFERRLPAPAPAWPEDAGQVPEWPGQVEAYVNDHFGFRTLLSALNSWLMVELGSSASDTVLVGKEGWLFHHRTKYRVTEESRGAVDIEEQVLDQWVTKLVETRNRYPDIPLVMTTIPNKHTVYPEYLPDWARPIGPTRLSRMADKLGRIPNLDFIDLRAGLADAKVRSEESGELLYYQTDTHWNLRGALVGYREIMAQVRRHFPEVRVLTESDLQISELPPKPMDLMRQHNIWFGLQERVTVVKLLQPSKVVRAEIISKSKGGYVREACSVDQAGCGHLMSMVHTDQVTAPRALVLGDSFTITLAPLFNESFRSVLYHHRGNRSLDNKLINSFQPDIILLNMIEKALVDSRALRSAPGFGGAQLPHPQEIFSDDFELGTSAWSEARG